MESIILNNVSATELKELISQTVREEFKTLHQPQPETELLTRKNVADILGISLVTLGDWTKRGLIPALRIGTRIRYKKADVMEALNQVETIKYGRV